MKHTRILKVLISLWVLFNMLLCFVFPFNQSASKLTSYYGGQAQVTTPVIPFENALLCSPPVTAPVAAITILNGSPDKGLNNKLFHHAFLCDAFSNTSFFNFYLKETFRSVVQLKQLHLTFCVLRI